MLTIKNWNVHYLNGCTIQMVKDKTKRFTYPYFTFLRSVIMVSQPSYNAVSAYRVIWKPRYKKLGFNRTNQANSYRVIWKPSTALYGNLAKRNAELVQITLFVPRYMETNKDKINYKLFLLN